MKPDLKLTYQPHYWKPIDPHLISRRHQPYISSSWEVLLHGKLRGPQYFPCMVLGEVRTVEAVGLCRRDLSLTLNWNPWYLAC